MSDLISRSALIEELNKSNKHHANNSREESLLDRTVRIVKEQQAAFDQEKVCFKIKEYFQRVIDKKIDYWDIVDFSKDIQDIVKAGGINVSTKD